MSAGFVTLLVFASPRQRLDRRADLLGGVEGMVVIEMGIARCRLLPSVPKQTADHRQGFLVHRGMTGKDVTQIVPPHAIQIGVGAQF